MKNVQGNSRGYHPQHKHGKVIRDADGHKIEVPFGKDSSDIGGGVRFPEDFKGGVRDLSHSIVGGKAPDPKS